MQAPCQGWGLLLNPAQEAVAGLIPRGGAGPGGIAPTVLLPLQTKGFGAEKEGLRGQVSGA